MTANEKLLGMKYTQEELQKAFNLVCDDKDWKAPIDSLCLINEMEIVSAAISHFTATKAKFNTIPENRKWARVTAQGYRSGPAGP